MTGAAPVRTTVPLAGWPTAVTVSASPSRSVSLASSASARRPESSAVVAVSSTRDRGVVDGGDVDRHRGGVGAAGAVGDGVGEGGRCR